MITAIPFPNIDPVLIEFGPLAIRWYALAFIGGLLLGWQYVKRFVANSPGDISGQDVDDFLVWATLGIVIGGRLGYVSFYNPIYYLQNPLDILQVWQGGMSFHGGLLGVVVAVILFVRRRKLPFAITADAIACAAPIGLFLGRLANFVNGELFGRVTDVPWAFVFPNGGPNPRHPSQLYEAALEGLVLFVLLYFLSRVPAIRNRPGVLTGIFMIGYAVARAIVEVFREPDAQIGFLAGGTTMGQLLSVPVLLIGIYFLARAKPQT